jgi:hypothetical protein
VRPLWEDPPVSGGQMVFIELSKEQDRSQEMESIWIEVMLRLIAGGFPEPDSILGVEYSYKPFLFRIPLWLSARSVDLSPIRDEMDEMARVTNAVSDVRTQLISAQ